MKTKTLKHPASLEVFYIEISDAWERRAKELQARRWEKIKQKEKEGLRHDGHSFS